MIRASAGSGKTFQLSNRFLALMALGVSPEKIIALTFTRKAAGEFTGRIMTRLAEGAATEKGAGRLSDELEGVIRGGESIPSLVDGELSGLPVMDQKFFQDLLSDLVASLDRLALSTLDSYFVRIVRNFALELGLSGFDLLEDNAITSERLNVMATIFSNRYTRKEERESFLHAFKQATWGEEENRLCKTLEEFVIEHQNRWLTAPEQKKWGGVEGIWPDGCPLPAGGDYQIKAQRVRSLLGEIENAHGSYINSWKKACDWMEGRMPGSPTGTVPARISDSLQVLEGLKSGHYQTVFSKREQVIKGALAQAVYEMCGAFLRDEIEIRMKRTQGLYSIISAYENQYHDHVRSRGRLCFSDLTLLLAGEGAMQLWEHEDRNLVDFRLDARYDHWLLDEFQDTSQPQWQAIHHLIDEIMQDTDGNRSLFVVGDSKQSIYGWRGGEPRLFEDIKDYYGDRLAEWDMDASYRSSSHVLDLVNTVCDLSSAKWAEIFPVSAIERWDYHPHVAAHQKSGHTLVLESALEPSATTDEKTQARYKAMSDLIEKVNPLARGLTCAVLVSKNAQVFAVVDYLRNEFPNISVASDSETTVADGPEGAAILDLFRWLQSPAHEFGKIHVQLSPLKPIIEQITETDNSNDQWRWLTNQLARHGVASLVQSIVDLLFEECDISPYGQSRLNEILTAANDFSNEGGSISDWVNMLESRRLRETTNDGMIQVMTVHKCKGLGFDIVILPELDQGKKFTDAGKVSVLERKGRLGVTDYIIKKPAKAICDAEPALTNMMQAWESEQCYERFCNLYVALTRAVHATYCILDPVNEKWKPVARFADWIREATSRDGVGSVKIGEETYTTLYESGDWLVEDKKPKVSSKKFEKIDLLPGVPRISRRVASGTKKYEAGMLLSKGRGMRFGNVVHQIFEKITWIDEMPQLGDEASAQLVADCLKATSIRSHFERPSGEFKLLREQPIETRINGEWVSGVIDRAVIMLEDDKPMSVSIVDYKTDTGETVDSLREKYQDQIALYRTAVANIYSLTPEKISCFLLSTALKEMVEV
ncbi:MAG: UvrD-helicase domain-containing protein [Akkermansiaceae bacterium]